MSLTPTVKAAYISAIATVIAALIAAGIFFQKDEKKNEDKVINSSISVGNDFHNSGEVNTGSKTERINNSN